jgi:hypothetical protein
MQNFSVLSFLLSYRMLETENAIQNYNNYENYFGVC